MNYIYGTCSPGGRSINLPASSGYSVTNLLISHVSMHDSETLMSLMNLSNSTIEYSKFYNNSAGDPAVCHPNVAQTSNTNNITFRYNEVHDWAVEGIMLMWTPNSNWFIYGNLWHDGLGGRSGNTHRVIESQYGANGPVLLYNNTFSNIWSGVMTANGGSWSSGSQGRNNIYWNMGGGPALPDEANNYTGTTNPFKSSTDFHLKAALPGATLTSTYNTDLDGATRGADGTWDIGAFEYISGISPDPAPSPPKTLRTR